MRSLLSPFPEQLFPAEASHKLNEVGRRADDRAALIEDGEQIAQTAATSLLARNLGGVHGVDARLGERESQPGERVEEIVQAFRPRLHIARFKKADLVVGVVGRGCDKAYGASARGAYADLFRHCVQRTMPSAPVEMSITGAHCEASWIA